MSAITGLLGLGGGASGTGFAKPTSANILAPTTTQQAGNAYTGNQQALIQQNALLQALQGQGGITNQSDVYKQLQGIASGTGPNPAQAMLNQATGQNVANQAALMAGQRGAGANVGLLARQAAQQGGALQQQAVGQGATMQAQQALGAIGQAGNIAGTQVANQIGATTANTQAQQSEQQQLLNAIQGQNAANVGMQSNINQSNAALAGQQMQGQQGLLGGVLGGVGSIVGSVLAEGGEVGEDGEFGSATDNNVPFPKPAQKSSGGGAAALLALLADGGEPSLGVDLTQATPAAPGPSSAFGQFLKGWSGSTAMQKQSAPQSQPVVAQSGPGALQQGMSDLIKGIGTAAGASLQAKGGQVRDFRGGGGVKAKDKSEKAIKAGNNYKNDKIPAVLSEGEVVIPRDVMQSADPVGNSAKFVQQVLARKRTGK